MRIQLAAEKLARARQALMLPHCRGEAEDIADAAIFSSQASELLSSVNLDDRERFLFEVIRKLTDTSGVESDGVDGVLVLRARQLTSDQRLELSRAVDELAHRLERRYCRVEYGRVDRSA